MKTLKTIFFLLALVASMNVVGQNFEGVITMTTTNSAMKEEADVTWYLKGDKSRMDIVSRADGHNTEYAIISDEKGIDMVAQGHVTAIPSSAVKSELRTLALVSEKDGVSMNGYTCRQLVYSDGVSQTTYWLTDGLNIAFSDIPALLRKNMPNISANGFPVRMEQRNKDGKVVLSQDVTAVRASTVDASKFARN